MKSILKPLLLSVVLACAGVTAIAQSPGMGAMTTTGAREHGRMDPAKMQQRMAAHMAELKAKLNLNGAQEDAWAQYVAAMQPPADAGRTHGPRRAPEDARGVEDHDHAAAHRPHERHEGRA